MKHHAEWIIGLLVIVAMCVATVLTARPVASPDPKMFLSDKAYIEQALAADVTVKEQSGKQVVTITFHKAAPLLPDKTALGVIRSHLER